MAGPAWLEHATYCFVGSRSIQLSYGPARTAAQTLFNGCSKSQNNDPTYWIVSLPGMLASDCSNRQTASRTLSGIACMHVLRIRSGEAYRICAWASWIVPCPGKGMSWDNVHWGRLQHAPSGNGEERLLARGQLLIKRVKKNSGGRGLAHQSNDLDQSFLPECFQGSGKSFRTHRLLAKGFTA